MLRSMIVPVGPDRLTAVQTWRRSMPSGSAMRKQRAKRKPMIVLSIVFGVAGCGMPVRSVPSVATAPFDVVTVGTTDASVPTASVGIGGVILTGPSCPVETPDRPCPPKPVFAHVIATTLTGQAVAATDSDASGRYRLEIAAGTYLVQVSGANFLRCAPVTVTVVAAFVAVDISCDTGIR